MHTFASLYLMRSGGARSIAPFGPLSDVDLRSIAAAINNDSRGHADSGDPRCPVGQEVAGLGLSVILNVVPLVIPPPDQVVMEMHCCEVSSRACGQKRPDIYPHRMVRTACSTAPSRARASG